MELRQLTEWADRVPFRPFTIEFENGRRCTVRHPENILFWPNRVKLFHIQAYDEGQARTVYFEPVAVTAIVEEPVGGAGPDSGR
jgi:hypothetical protein